VKQVKGRPLVALALDEFRPMHMSLHGVMALFGGQRRFAGGRVGTNAADQRHERGANAIESRRQSAYITFRKTVQSERAPDFLIPTELTALQETMRASVTAI